MAHQLDTQNGKTAFAFTGSRDAIWHGLGQQLSENESIEVWRREAGMDWTVEESAVYYQSTETTLATFPKKKVLHRSDNHYPLSIVGSDFKVVQPGEVLEFFRDLTASNQMRLSTAGCLFNGQRFWALAETGREEEVVNGDLVKGHLLFITSVDGTLSSQAKFVSTRVVCNNTLNIALGETTNRMFKKTHKAIWDNNQAKIDLGLMDTAWENFINNLRKLSARRMTDAEVKAFLTDTFNPAATADDSKWGRVKQVNNLYNLYQNGAGAQYGRENAWGVLNAVTNLFTHGDSNRKNRDAKFQDAFYKHDQIKTTVMERLLELC